MMTRDTRLTLIAFAAMTLAVTVNLTFFQGQRRPGGVETSAIAQTPFGRGGTVEQAIAGSSAAEQAPPPAEAPPQGVAEQIKPMTSALPPVSQGMNRFDIVRAIQRSLGERGYDPGKPDGVVGLVTRAAIMAWEYDNARSLTAEPTEQLMADIVTKAQATAASARGAMPEVKTSEAASVVRSVGQWLAALGYPLQKTESTFTEAMSRAIRDYEASQKMPETGRISAPLVARLSRAAQSKQAAR
mgnify:CR=1 FL=1